MSKSQKISMKNNLTKFKILIVGDPGSIHTAKFVTLLQEIGCDVRIFQSEYYYLQDEHLRNTIIYVAYYSQEAINNNIILSDKVLKYQNRFYIIFGRLFGSNIPLDLTKYPRSKHLAKVVNQYRPDIIFSLKMQNDGYTVAEAKENVNNFAPKWVHFNWGTDIEFFGKNHSYKKEHLPKIKNVLSNCDFFIADCKRDEKQAKNFGLRGKNLGNLIATGGFDLKAIAKIKAKYHRRNIILIKGRQGGLVGKAFNVLKALEQLKDELKNYQIKIIMASPEVKGVADYLEFFEGIKLEIIPRLPYNKLLALFAQSKIAISASDVDGSPLFLLEAMAMGAFPIHSDMESVREWIKDGENGLLFPVDDIERLSSCINQALNNQDLIDKAKLQNWQIAQRRMNKQEIKIKIMKMIENDILGEQ
jgi:glycosyltransferase involved in cell wall biosynthesis